MSTIPAAQKTPKSHKAKHAPAKKLIWDPLEKKPISSVKRHPKAFPEPGGVTKWFARVEGFSVPRWRAFDFGNCKYRQPSARLN